MKGGALLLALVAALSLQSALAEQVEGPSIADALKAAGANRYLALAAAAGASGALAGVPALGTPVFAPSDAAVDGWLKANGMSLQDVTGRERLADLIVGYSMLAPGPGGADDATADLPRGGPRARLATLLPEWPLTAWRGADGALRVADSSGDEAAVPAPAAGSHVYVMDKLLLPGSVLGSFAALEFDSPAAPGGANTGGGGAVKRRPLTLFKELVARAGATQTAARREVTVFAPTCAAFEAAGLTKALIAAMSPAQAKELIAYHTLTGYKPIPAAKPDVPLPTELFLGGAPKAVTLSYGEPAPAAAGGGRSAAVADAAGGVANIVAPNWFAGRVTLHIIDRVLLPSKSFLPAPTPAAAAAGGGGGGRVAAEAAAAEDVGEGADEGVEAAEGPSSSAAPATPRQLAGGGGHRKLLQSTRRGSVTSSMLAARAAKAAIQSAIDDDSPAAVRHAANVGAVAASSSAFKTSRDFLIYGDLYTPLGGY